MRFLKNAESEYKNFMKYIKKKKKISFVDIRIVDEKTEEYLVDVDNFKVGRLKEKGNILLSNISFYCTTNWYKQKNIIYTIEENANVFGFPIDFINMRFGNGSSNKLLIENDGFEEAPLLIEIEGPIVNPRIELIENKEIINGLYIPIEIEEFEKIEYSTKDNDLFIRKINKDGSTENLFNLLDINSISNFFKIPVGVTNLLISAENNIKYARATVYLQY